MGIVTTDGSIKAKTDSIDWTDVTGIKTNTDTINWNDVTGIATTASSVQAKTDTINWANVTAIKSNTDTINWNDVTGIATTASSVQAKTDTINWANVTAIKSNTDTINWADVTGIVESVAADTAANATEAAVIAANNAASVATLAAQTATLSAQQAQLTSVQKQVVAGLLNTETTVKSGNTITIKYKAETGLTGSGAPKLNLYDATNTLRVTNATMTENGSTGVYQYDVTFLAGWGTGSYTVRAAESTNNTRDSMQLFVGSSDLQSIGSAVASANANLDVLLGAFIVSQSSINDTSPSLTSFTTALTNSTDNFYKNSVITFTSGALKGQSRRVSGYNGTTKIITLDPALTSTPSDGDQFTIVAQNVHVEETVNIIATSTADIATKVTDIGTKVSDIQTKVSAIQTKLDAVDTKLDTLQTSINTVRTSQQSNYTVDLSSPAQIQAGATYRAKLEISDYQALSADAAGVPTITIFDSTRTAVITNASMTHGATGEYEYTYTIDSGATGGLWESVVTVPVGGGTQTRTNYWTVTGSPAQVLINSMTSLNVPTISAAVTITNEGGSDYEYQYQWCVVRNQSDQCDGGNAISSASAAKLIHTGENFTPTLSLQVPTPGNYWFKLIVTFGGQSSAASLNFTAVGTSTTTTNSGGGIGTSTGGTTITDSSTGSLDVLRALLETNAVKMNTLLTTLGGIDTKATGIASLLEINAQNTQSLKDVQNKLADLKAVSATLHQLADQKSVNPIVQTYMKFNSVEIHFLVTNPATQTQTVQFKAFLPEEVKPEYVENADGLKIDYDPEAKTYYVSADITLDAGESVTKKVEMKDIWMFTPEQLSSISTQATGVVNSLAHTQYAAQATLLNNDIIEKIAAISQKQAQSYDSPQNHIVVYRDNIKLFDQVQTDFGKIKDLLVQSGASAGLLGSVGGIQTFATWGIVLAILFGFGVMGAVVYFMWRNQMIMNSMLMGMAPEEIKSTFIKQQQRKKILRRVAN